MVIPKSSVSYLSIYSGVFGYLLAFILIPVIGLKRPHDQSVFMCLMIFCSLTIPDLIQNPISKNPDFDFSRVSIDLRRIGIKLFSFGFLVVLFLFLYSLFPEYQGKFYRNFWLLLSDYGYYLLFLSVLYILFVDCFLRLPDDSLYFLGLFVVGFPLHEDQKRQVYQFALSAAVKFFFLPLMWVYISNSLSAIYQYVPQDNATYLVWYRFLYKFVFLTDVCFGMVGYLFTMKLFDTHVRSVDSSWLGWVSALSCYPPFNSVLGNAYLNYNMDRYTWESAIAYPSVLYYLWGSIILVLITIYMFATLVYGARFSNLTYRGLITSGPYRYTKHPAYICKNLSWWLVSIPFYVSTNVVDSLKSCFLLLMLNCVYYVRAKTEENHLMRYQEYRDYAAYIRANGVLSSFLRSFGMIQLSFPFIRKSKSKPRKNGKFYKSIRVISNSRYARYKLLQELGLKQ